MLQRIPHRCSPIRKLVLNKTNIIQRSGIILPSLATTHATSSSSTTTIPVCGAISNNQVRSMAWANRVKKPKSKHVKQKMLEDFPTSKKLEHFYIYKNEGRLPTMNIELYKEFLYYCVMEAISDPHAVDKALEIAKAAVDEAGHELDIEAYTYLIQVCSLNRRIELVEKLWQEMDEKKVGKDNQQIYGAMLRAYCLMDNETKCKELYAEMLQKDLVPKFITFERLYKNIKYL